MKKHLLPLLLLITAHTLIGQTKFESYYPIISHGSVSNDFVLDRESRYTKQLSSLTEKEIKELKKDRFLYAFLNFYSQQLIYNSGFVTYNDPISVYAGKILDLLLKEDMSLRKKLRIYLVKSTAVNAFTTNDGVIFISVGLMAQIQSEAQLAFVLAHEIIHYIDKHHINDYINLRDVIKELDRNSSYDETLQSLFSYSKQHELDADLEGYKRFYKNSGYSIKEIENLFDVLLYSYLPFDEVKFDLDFFETENYHLPENYKLSKYNEITAIENYDDSESTHPNIVKRRAQILDAISGNMKTGLKYLVSESDFNIVQEAARFELSYLYQICNNFEKAIYNSFLLLKKYPDNKFLKTNIAESLYGLTFYKNRNDFKKAHIEESKIEGYSQQVFHLFEMLDGNEMNLLTLRYFWNLKNTYKDDDYISEITDSLISEISWAFTANLSDFPLEKLAKVEHDSAVNLDDLSKTEKIKFIKQVDKKANIDDKYYYNALLDLPNQAELIKRYEKFRRNTPPSIRKNRDEDDDNYYRSLRNVKVGNALGINKIVMFPVEYYARLESFSSEEINAYFRNDIKIRSTVKKIAQKLNLEFVELKTNETDKVNTEQINDYCLLSSWLNELHFQNNTDYIPATQKYIKSLSNKYGTNYFAWIGVNYKEYGSYELLVMDISTKKVVAYYNQSLPVKAFDFLKLNIYNSFYRVKSTKK